MRKEWISDIPMEIRMLVYTYLFSNHAVRMHGSTCSCDSNCPIHHAATSEHDPSIFFTLRDVIWAPDLRTPRCVRVPACLHTSLFLTCKTVLNEARPVFYHLSTFQTHPACIADLPHLLEEFTSRDPSWTIGHLRDLEAHENDKDLSKTLLSQYNGHIARLSLSFAHTVLGWIDLEEEIGYGFWGNMATQTKLTVTNGYHVHIQDEGIKTVEKIKRLFQFAYSEEDYDKVDFEYGGSSISH